MQNYCKTIGALAAASALVAGNASAEIEYEIHGGYHSQYIFRGIDLGNDLIDAGVDLATEVNGLGLSAGVWYGSTQEAPGAGSIAYDEIDIYGEVSKDLGFLTASVGYIYYYFPQNTAFPTDDAQELYASVSREFFGFDVSATYYWDLETDNDGYSELGISKGYELSPCLTLSTGAALGYLFEEGDLSHVQAKVSLDWAFTETATLSPYIAHSWSLSEGGRFAGVSSPTTAGYGGAQNEFFGGVSLAVSF